MTSNVGAHMLKNQAALGFQSTSTDVTYDKMKEALMREVEREFRPEFLNRLDDVIVFRPLDRNDLSHIVGIELQGVTSRLADVNVVLVVSEEAKEWLIDKGYNPDYGARPLRRAVEQSVEDPMAEEVLRGAFRERSKVTVGVKDGELSFASEAAPLPPDPVGVAVPSGEGDGAAAPEGADSTPDAT
jgi:ATP-dependent Clp protease ATP-binding subunit ClpC